MPEFSPYAAPGEALADQARIRGDQEAVAFPEATARMTFGEWHAKSSSLARALLDRGLGPGDHIGLLAEARIEWPVVQMAVALMGGVLVPLNTHYASDDLAYALKTAETRCLFLSEAFRGSRYLDMVRDMRAQLTDLEILVALDGDHDDTLSYAELIVAGSASDTSLPAVDPDAVASLQFTSGTTGFPKGALLTHAGMMANAYGISGRLKVTESDRWTSIIPLFHCAGCIMCVLGTVQRGNSYIGVSAFDPAAMLHLIETERCTMLSGVPTSYLAMLNHPDHSTTDLSTLRAGTCGGADTDPMMLQQCAEAFPIPGVVQVYGQTEASTLISLADCDDSSRFDTCGPPLPGAEVRITDPETRGPLEPGEIGQIETAGPMVMRGYFGNDAATAETIGDDGWMRTGDLGYLTDQGHIVVAGGRLRDMIIRGGENIYPVEIENLLRTHPAVGDVAVFGVPDDYYGEIVGAAVDLSDGTDSRDLTTFCHGRIARFKIPARFYQVNEFPMTASGKIRKAELQVMAMGGKLALLKP